MLVKEVQREQGMTDKAISRYTAHHNTTPQSIDRYHHLDSRHGPTIDTVE